MRVFASEPTRKQWMLDLRAAELPHSMKKAARQTFSTWPAEAGVPNDRRKRLLRHIDGLVDVSYTDRRRLMPQMQRDVEQLVHWYEAKPASATA